MGRRVSVGMGRGAGLAAHVPSVEWLLCGPDHHTCRPIAASNHVRHLPIIPRLERAHGGISILLPILAITVVVVFRVGAWG